MSQSIIDWADEHGYRIAWGHPTLLDQIREKIQARVATAEIDRIVSEQYLCKLRYLEGLNLSQVKTVGVIVVPRPAHLVTFFLEDGTLEAVVPPTYIKYEETSAETLSRLASVLSGQGHRLEPLRAPLKTLAAMLGLVNYGRNNITYAQGLGSYFQLVGFASDRDLGPMPEVSSTGPAPLPLCQRCTACRKSCPTGAIGQDRFLLHAGRCLTLWTELGGPWPDWLSPSAHHCLVGCLACQSACPQNSGLLRFEPVQEHFTAEETATILAGPEEGTGAAWDGIKAKLASIGLPGFETEIGRNLRALVENRRPTSLRARRVRTDTGAD